MVSITVNPTDSNQFEYRQNKSNERRAEEVHKIQYILSTGSNVDQTDRIAYNGNAYCNYPVFSVGEPILKYSHHAWCHAHIASNTQHKEHQEEQHGE